MIEPRWRDTILARIDAALAHAADRQAAAAACMRILDETLAHFDWTGVYWLEGDTLVLGPYRGAATEHDRIPVGRGVCGTAVAEDANQVIDDVRSLDNYLACSAQTRAEIVVLIRDEEGRVLGQIDVDGHRAGAFDASDEALLEAVAARIAAAPDGEA